MMRSLARKEEPVKLGSEESVVPGKTGIKEKSSTLQQDGRKDGLTVSQKLARPYPS